MKIILSGKFVFQDESENGLMIMEASYGIIFAKERLKQLKIWMAFRYYSLQRLDDWFDSMFIKTAYKKEPIFSISKKWFYTIGENI